MANKRLNATITIGGTVKKTLTQGLKSTKTKLGDVGQSIRTVEKRQKTLSKAIDTFGRQGKNVDRMRQEYGQLTTQMETLRRTQQRLLKVEKARARVGVAAGKFRSDLGNAVGTVRRLALAGVVAGGSIFALTNKVAGAGDEVAKTARSIGFQTDMFQEYQFAADRVGVTQGTFNQSLQAFGKRLGELKTRGSGALATQLKETNPALYETLRTTESTSEAFEIFIQAMREASNQAERNALASAAFSRAGLKMGLISQASSEEIEKLRKRAQELGHVLSSKDLDAAEKFTDDLTDMKASMGGVGKLIGSQLMPVMSGFFTRFTGFVVENRDKISGWAKTVGDKAVKVLPKIFEAAKGIGSMAMAVGRLIGKAADLVGGFENLAIVVVGLKLAPLIISTVKLGIAAAGLVSYLPLVAGGIKAIGVALMANPIGLAVGLIAGAAFLIYKNWAPIKEFFIGLWDGIKSVFFQGVEFVKEYLGWTPLGLVMNNWEPLTGFFGGLWDGIVSKASEAFDWIAGKLKWIGDAAGKVASFFGIGEDDSDSQETVRRTGRGRGAMVGRVMAEAANDDDEDLAPIEQAERKVTQRNSTDSRTQVQRAGDTFNLVVNQQPGEDGETLAQRVAQIVEEKRRREDSAALFDNAAGAY